MFASEHMRVLVNDLVLDHKFFPIQLIEQLFGAFGNHFNFSLFQILMNLFITSNII